MAVPTRVADRLVAGLRRFQPILSSAKSRDVNESDTSRIVTDVLSELFGYDRYSEITTEYAIRGTYCDLAIKIDGKLQLLVEVKAIGLDLKDAHIKQAVDYAANEGLEWVALTNGANWKIFKIVFGKPIAHESVLDLDLLALNPKNADHIESLFLLSREAVLRAHLLDYHAQLQAMNRFTIAAMILGEPVVSVLRREIRKMSPGVRVDEDQLLRILESDVLKRDVLDGEKAVEARRKVQRFLTKSAKRPAPTAVNPGESSADDPAPPVPHEE